MAVHSTQIITQNIFVANEIPIGNVDGINKVFTLAYTPIVDTVIVFLATIQVPGSGLDYTISGSTITFIKAPKIGQEVVVSYFK